MEAFDSDVLSQMSVMSSLLPIIVKIHRLGVELPAFDFRLIRIVGLPQG